MNELKYDVFISYRRKEGGEIARLLQRCLQDEGISVFLDVDELGAGHFDERLLRTIEEVQSFLVVLSRDCLERCLDPEDWLRKELATALRTRRNIVPVMTPEFSFPEPSKLPAVLRDLPRHHGVQYSHEFFHAMMEKLLCFLKSPTGRERLRTVVRRQTGDRTQALRKNSLGQVLIRVPLAYLPSRRSADEGLYVSNACVSNHEYLQYVRAGGTPPRRQSKYPDQRTWKDDGCPKSMLDHPVIYVTQADARNFCLWLTKNERQNGTIGSEETYTLPTFAQWKAFAKGIQINGEAVLLDRRWIAGQYQPTAPVTWDKFPSELGLMHLLGNVFEWCLDESPKLIVRAGKRIKILCYLASGGGWGSTRSWLEQSIRDGTYGAIWCPYGWILKDGGFRVCLISHAARASPPAT